jgi:hypothetical protein
MRISPQIETIPDPQAYTEYAHRHAGIPGGESPYTPEEPDRREEPPLEGAGEFAEILAGLIRGSESAGDEAAIDTGPGALVVPPAETAEAGPGKPDAEFGGGNKSRPVKPVAGGEPVQAGQSGRDGAIETELAEFDLSEEDQNILLGMELLLSRSAEQIPLDGEEAAPAGESPAAALTVFSGGAETVEAAATAAAADEPAGAGENPAPGRRLPVSAEDAPRSAAGPAETAGLAAAVQGAEGTEQADRGKDDTEKENRGHNGPGRLEEVRARRRDRPALEVRDLRTAGGRSPEGGLASGDLRVSTAAETHRQDGAGTGEITLELRLPNQGQNAPGAETVWEVKASQAVENLLARELHQNFNNDIVRHASMMLRDEGAGTIRLALKPESLGNVKIRLEMAENKITGHIVVESEEALRAFEREVHSLEQAFKESGFEAANLEMSLAGNGGGAEQDWRETGSFLAGRMIASQYDAALEGAETPLQAVVDVYQRGPAAINLLA